MRQALSAKCHLTSKRNSPREYSCNNIRNAAAQLPEEAPLIFTLCS
jgi:hypothetical protein